MDQLPQAEDLVKPDLNFLNTHPFVRKTVLDKVYGCMIGSALGDTIGLYTEFLPKHACETVYKDGKFSLDPMTEYYPDNHRNRFDRCAWTDDTDQALLILLSYLRHHTTQSPNLAPSPTTQLHTTLSQDFASRLKIWIDQGLRALSRPPCGIGQMVGSVVRNSQYVSDPVGTATTRWIKTSRHNAPNGSLMRTHPIGIIGIGWSEEATWQLATGIGRTTHVDPRCVVACCISVGLIRGFLRGDISSEEEVDKAIERAYDWVSTQPELMNPGLDTELTEWEIKRHLERKEFEKHVYAQTFDELKLDSAMEMGYTYKCLGSSLLSLRLAMRAVAKAGPDSVPPNGLFESLISSLVMEGGDADTNAVVAGAFLGAYLGHAHLPLHWTKGLAHREWLHSKIWRLTKVIGILEGEVGDEADELPDGGKGLMTVQEMEKRDQEFVVMVMTRDKERRDKEEKERNKGKSKGLLGLFK
ncbi:ADP-ribosylglycohydrolase-domain-containing protein [Dendryphion nanum]|uniref:ADP-ribosylglycohydrolase-domain-containing protein n=1 Tax=Dendryphion nanum TaxID=256645 RepID=A0A9P9E0U3_9PLEO|nr:ADP-ribosylglycohydrolase-domain-containing protein [Dendryphion nanum]